jgi:hypothetical protein
MVNVSLVKSVLFTSFIFPDLQSNVLFEMMGVQSGQIFLMGVIELIDLGGGSSTVMNSLASTGNLGCELGRDQLLLLSSLKLAELSFSSTLSLLLPALSFPLSPLGDLHRSLEDKNETCVL